MNYQEADSLLQGRCKARRKLANNTYLHRIPANGAGDVLAVQLHATDVVTFHPDGRTVLDSGGWRTPTTKARINDYAPVNLWQDKGTWFVSAGYPWVDGSGMTPYADGFTIHPDGTFSNVGEDPKAQQTLRKRIRKFARTYANKLAAREIPAPSGGDCWLCSMFDRNGLTGDKSHLFAHLDESYFVPSLLVNAANEFGASRAALDYMHASWGEGNPHPPETCEQVRECWGRGIATEQLRKALTRYLYRHMDAGAS